MDNGERTVVVIGGSRGIGRATALEFARLGYNTVVTYNTRRSEAEAVAREAARLGAPRTAFYRVDVTLEDSLMAAAEAVSRDFGWVNVLVYSAGILQLGGIEGIGLEEWNRVIGVNLTGAFLAVKAFLPLLRRASLASIVMISSIAGQTGNVVAGVAYAVSKAGLIGLAKRLAVELAGEGIRVNAVAPSFVETDMVRGLIERPEDRKRVEQLHPLGFILDPVDVAKAIVFLADPAWSRGITGHVLQVNGGRLT